MKSPKFFHLYFGTIIGFVLLLSAIFPFINKVIIMPVIGLFTVLMIPLNMLGILNTMSLLVLYFLLIVGLMIFQYAYLYKFTRQKIALVIFYFLHLAIFFLTVTFIHVNTSTPNSNYLLFKIAIPLPLFGICFDLSMKEYYKEKES